ncbi:hypothetical protein Fcan01_12283 [Folsomia candida]|uniref:Tudor domain-containing protein n=1 Tax=Folsomia candida TaxID=158441 RepID=A0A226E6N5_FOLCA|nr:hypothetical protein Fcan01_12283 [Folsomia candida]
MAMSGRGRGKGLIPVHTSSDDSDDDEQRPTITLEKKQGQQHKEDNESPALEEWLNRKPEDDIPDFIRESLRFRDLTIITKDEFLPTMGMGRGRGRTFRSTYADGDGPGSSGLSQAESDSSRNSIFGAKQKQVTKLSHKTIVSDKRFQSCMEKHELKSSWDSEITKRARVVTMTDRDFCLSIKTAGKGADNECDHLIINTNCACIPDRDFGVCVRCLLVFCNHACLKTELEKGSGRVGLSSKDVLKEGFGISKQKGEDGRTKKVRKAPGTSIPTPVPVPPTNETKDSDSFVAAPPKRDILEDKLEIDSQVSQVIDSDSPVPTGPAASLDCKFNVGDKIRVKVCPRPTSYQHFSVIEDNKIHEVENIESLMERLASFGIAMFNLRNFPLLTLCCVRHPVTTKYARGNIKAIEENGRIKVLLIDSGETYLFRSTELLELPDVAMSEPPLAYPCALPIIPIGVTEENAAIMNRFRRINKYILEASILAIDEEGCHVVDLFMESENVTFCEALLKINEAQFDCSDELQLTITNQFASRVKPLLPSFDYISREPKALIHRMSSLGLEPDSSDTLETLIPSPLTIAEEDFKHSYNRLIALPTVYELKDKVCKFNRFLGMNNFSVIEVGAEVHIGNLKEAIKDWISTGSESIKYSIEETLRINQVVLCPLGAGYVRGVIKLVKDNMVEVRLLEYGTKSLYSISQLIRPDDKILKIPLFVYFVKLAEVQDDIPILVEQFRKLRSLVNDTARITEVIHDPNSKTILPRVKMINESGESLACLLNQLAVWRWRQLYRGQYIHMDEIVSADAFPSRDDYLKKCLLGDLLKRAVLDVTIQYYSVPDHGTSIVVYCLPHDHILNYHSRTLQYQMQLLFYRTKPPCMSKEEFVSYPHMLSVRPELELSDDPLEKKELRKFAQEHFPRGSTTKIIMSSKKPYSFERKIPLYRAVMHGQTLNSN